MTPFGDNRRAVRDAYPLGPSATQRRRDPNVGLLPRLLLAAAAAAAAMLRLAAAALRLAATLAVAAPAARALLVAPGSPCSASCGNVLDSTSPADVDCASSGAASQIFQGCVE